MEIKEAVSIGKSSQSMGSKEICILVVNDDLTCNNIVSEMLQRCNYEVMHIGGVLDALNAVWESKDKLDLVLTNAHKLESNGIEIVQHIQRKLNLPIILMCPDKTKIASKGHPFSFAAYAVKGLSRNEVNNLWQFALEKEKGKMDSNIAVGTKETCSSRKRKTRERSEESKEDDHPPMAKKPRVVWTIDMHQKFLEAIEILGYEKAVPKKIVEVMGIPGLTRENVASHLQKFRGSMRRNQEAKELEAIRLLPLTSTSTLQESIAKSNSKYLNTNEKFSFVGTNNYTLQQKYIPKDHFRIYGDQMRNMLININKTSSFVGYRLTSDGNSIKYGNEKCLSKEAFGNATDLLQNPCGSNTASSSIPLPRDQDFSIPPLEIAPGEDRTSQVNQMGLLEGLSQEQYNCSPSSLPQMMQYLDDFLDQDDDLIKGNGATCNEFEWEEFDVTFFKNDDD